MNTTENNKIIAEFMGAKYDKEIINSSKQIQELLTLKSTL